MAHIFIFKWGIKQMQMTQADYEVPSLFHDLIKNKAHKNRLWIVQNEMESIIGPQNYQRL